MNRRLFRIASVALCTLALSLIIVQGEASALSVKRGALGPNGQSRVYGQQCKLRILSKSTSRFLVVRCRGRKTAAPRRSTRGIVHLTKNEELRISARGECSLRTSVISARQLAVHCRPGQDSSPATPTPTPVPGPSISLSPGVLSLVAGGSAAYLTVTNNSTTGTALNIQATLPGSFNDVTQDSSDCASVAPGASCQLSFVPGATSHAQQQIQVQGSNTNQVSASLEVLPNVTTLTASLSRLALSVAGRTLDGFPSGTSRSVTISNTGSLAATGLMVSFPTFPSGTSASTTCGATLAPSASCTITVTPGANASSDCATGVAAVPGLLSVSADNANSLTTDVVVLDYGCIYQEGFVFAMDESTSATQSIGGTVAALTDQAEPFVNFVVWASNGTGSTTGHGSFDLVPGIDQSSTAIAGSPSFADFSTRFASTYTNMLTLSSSSFEACVGAFDGACNTRNVVAFYNTYQTNFDPGDPPTVPPPYTAIAAPTASEDYAAGICDTYDSGSYTDWYLPAICEMGYDDRSEGSGCGTFASPSAQTMEINLFINSVGGLASWFYWSSTAYSLLAGQEAQHAWVQLFRPTGNSPWQVPGDKDLSSAGVRCVRRLTP